MTEIKFYKCDFCGKKYDTQKKAESCENFHEKDLKISSTVYDTNCYKGMPSEIRLENKERTKLAIYKICDVVER